MFKNILIYLSVIITFLSTLNASDLSHWLRPSEVPQPEDNKLTKEKIALGKLLFFDKRLSLDDSISCASCHHPEHGWSDLHPKAAGFEGRKGPRNSPTILNAAYQKHQFWDGRVKTLEEQALGPIVSDVEMNMPIKTLLKKLQAIKGYKKHFELVFPNEGITEKTLAKALASFERTIVSGDSAFDDYAKGDKEAISQEAKEGFEIFQNKAQCINCHDGWNFSDGSFHNIGLNASELQGAELGRYSLKKRAALYGAFKTPTLRDIAKSSPYFHDGSAASLKDAVELCSKGGRHTKDVQNLSTAMGNRELSEDEIAKLISFLLTLSSPDLNISVPTQFPN